MGGGCSNGNPADPGSGLQSANADAHSNAHCHTDTQRDAIGNRDGNCRGNTAQYAVGNSHRGA